MAFSLSSYPYGVFLKVVFLIMSTNYGPITSNLITINLSIRYHNSFPVHTHLSNIFLGVGLDLDQLSLKQLWRLHFQSKITYSELSHLWKKSLWKFFNVFFPLEFFLSPRSLTSLCPATKYCNIFIRGVGVVSLLCKTK